MQPAGFWVSIALLFVAVYVIVRQILMIQAERALRETNQFAREIL